MFLKDLTKLNIIVFSIFFISYMTGIATDARPVAFLLAISGLAVFFIVGLDAMKLVEKAFKLEFDFWEFLTLGIFTALFFMPLIVYILYKASGSMNEIWVVLVYFLVSAGALIASSIIEKKNKNGKN